VRQWKDGGSDHCPPLGLMASFSRGAAGRHSEDGRVIPVSVSRQRLPLRYASLLTARPGCTEGDSDPRYCFIGGTTCGNGVAAAAGIATLNVLRQPGTYERLYEIGERFRNGARRVFARHGIPSQVFGSGPLAQIALIDKPVVDYRSSVSGNLPLQQRLTNALIRRGVLTHGKFYFSLALSDEDIDRIVDALDEAVRTIATEGMT